MEIIPILSTIILATTASTFLLAIGAYILYKIRERRARKSIIYHPAKFEAEFITPVRSGEERLRGGLREHQADDARNLNLISSEDDTEFKKEKKINPAAGESKNVKSKFLKYTFEGYISPKDDKKTGTIRWR
jgi:hypothetical protein